MKSDFIAIMEQADEQSFYVKIKEAILKYEILPQRNAKKLIIKTLRNSACFARHKKNISRKVREDYNNQFITFAYFVQPLRILRLNKTLQTPLNKKLFAQYFFANSSVYPLISASVRSAPEWMIIRYLKIDDLPPGIE